MAALIEDTLPAALASRLNDEQRQAFTDAPRGGKLTALAIALAKSEADLLTEIAGLVKLDIALNLETDPDARGILPSRLVHEFQIIPIKKLDPRDSSRQGTEKLDAAELAATFTILSNSF